MWPKWLLTRRPMTEKRDLALKWWKGGVKRPPKGVSVVSFRRRSNRECLYVRESAYLKSPITIGCVKHKESLLSSLEVTTDNKRDRLLRSLRASVIGRQSRPFHSSPYPSYSSGHIANCKFRTHRNCFINLSRFIFKYTKVSTPWVQVWYSCKSCNIHKSATSQLESIFMSWKSGALRAKRRDADQIHHLWWKLHPYRFADTKYHQKERLDLNKRSCETFNFTLCFSTPNRIKPKCIINFS